MPEPCWVCNEPVEIDEGLSCHEGCLRSMENDVCDLVTKADPILGAILKAAPAGLDREEILAFEAALEKARRFL